MLFAGKIQQSGAAKRMFVFHHPTAILRMRRENGKQELCGRKSQHRNHGSGSLKAAFRRLGKLWI